MILGVLATLAVVLVVVLSGGGGQPQLPLPGTGLRVRTGDPFAYRASRASEFQARAVAGSSGVLYTQSPGGAIATAKRVADFRPLIEQATAGTGVDPNLVEGIVFVESAGRPDVIAGSSPVAASGLTQILAATGQSLLGMHIDLPASTQLTRRIALAAAAGRDPQAVRLERARARIDDRFDPRLALRATVRYLQIAASGLHRADLAAVSYHMGIGNLEQVLKLYDGGTPVPYVQLFFDTAPDHHGSAYRLLQGFGDQSSLYLWRVLGAVQIMRQYRNDPAGLARTAALQTASSSTAALLHPPARTPRFADPTALFRAYAGKVLVPLPAAPGRTGLAYSSALGSLARRLSVPRALYRGLRPAALDLLEVLALRVKKLCGCAPLILSRAVSDRRYEGLVGDGDDAPTTGYTFQLRRRYVSGGQALALQAMLDRLQALNLITWARYGAKLEVTVAGDAAAVISRGP